MSNEQQRGAVIGVEHSIVYAAPGIYAGWPANHGAWQWGDEFLVGFLRGRYQRKSMHNIAEPFEKVLARSLDGGRTWSVEVPNVDFECHERAVPPDAPAFALGDHVLRVCGVYDHGGDECFEPGGFYKSADRGRSWDGPYRFTGLEQQLDGGEFICTARTRTSGGLVFLSRGQRLIWGTDSTFCAEHDGRRFVFKSTVLDDSARAVMPAVAEVGGRVVVAMRRRKTAVREGWIDVVHSDDGGATWSKPRQVGVTGSRNGNPPALVALPDGRLVCCYGNRDFGSMVAAISSDGGESWSASLLRDGSEEERDVGYPQLFVRSDGVPVCVYYWADALTPHQHIAATALEV